MRRADTRRRSDGRCIQDEVRGRDPRAVRPRDGADGPRPGRHARPRAPSSTGSPRPTTGSSSSTSGRATSSSTSSPRSRSARTRSRSGSRAAGRDPLRGAQHPRRRRRREPPGQLREGVVPAREQGGRAAARPPHAWRTGAREKRDDDHVTQLDPLGSDALLALLSGRRWFAAAELSPESAPLASVVHADDELELALVDVRFAGARDARTSSPSARTARRQPSISPRWRVSRGWRGSRRRACRRAPSASSSRTRPPFSTSPLS